MTKTEEKKLFSNWDVIYKNIRTAKVNSAVIEKSPENSEELYKVNAISAIIKDHKPAKHFTLDKINV